jgi:hypothetical protein
VAFRIICRRISTLHVVGSLMPFDAATLTELAEQDRDGRSSPNPPRVRFNGVNSTSQSRPLHTGDRSKRWREGDVTSVTALELKIGYFRLFTWSQRS